MKKSLIILVAAALVLSMSFFVFGYAAGAGSETDPVVTKSYVDGLISSLKEELKTEIANTPAQSAGGDSFVAVKIEQGKKVVCGAGTEVILRSGTAQAVDNETNDGIPDLTSGTNIKGGRNLTPNHLLIIPKADGRGIFCSDESWIMIKGSYTLE